MATSGNIQTLFKNREQTEAIFPRTKVRAVTDDDGNRLDVILEDVVHIGDKVIDTSSIPINADSLGSIPAEDYATEAWVKNEIANIQAGEDVDLSGFASQDDITLLNKRINELDYPVDSVNEKTGAVVLNATDVGAHPNTWLPTPAQIGAATSEEMARALRVVWTKMPNKSANYDECTDFGIYWVNMWAGTASEGNNQPPANDTGWMYVYGNADTCLIQEWHTSANGVIVRRCVTNTWGEWEWENPPMVLSKEYRTTERWNGKAVYTKLVNYGTLPATNTSTGESAKNKDVDIGISYANVIDLQAVVTAPSIQLTAGNILISDASKLEYKFTMIGTKIRCTVTGDYSGWSAVVRVKYTKD